MKSVEFWRWILSDPETGEQRRTTWRMRWEEALQHDRNAQPIPCTKEVRKLPENRRVERDAVLKQRGGQ